MNETYLTASEIYELDKVTESDILEHLRDLLPEKREVASHVFSKNRIIGMLNARIDEKSKRIDSLISILDENGIDYA